MTPKYLLVFIKKYFQDLTTIENLNKYIDILKNDMNPKFEFIFEFKICMKDKIEKNLPKNLDVFVLTSIQSFKLDFSSLEYLPEKLQVLYINSRICLKMEKLPKKLKVLNFASLDNKNIPHLPFLEKDYPKELKILRIECADNHELNISLPKLKILNLGDGFNKNLDVFLNEAKNLKILKFSNMSLFNQPIFENVKNLKNLNLKILQFGPAFNQPIDKFLRSTERLKVLEFGNFFNQSLDNIGSLAKNLRVLKLDCEFNQSLKNLPKKLKILKLESHQYNQELNLKKLKNLKFLRILSNKFNQKLEGKLPKNIKILELYYDLQEEIKDVLQKQKKIKVLRLGYEFDQSLDQCGNLKLKILELGNKFNQKLRINSNKLKILKFSQQSDFNHSLNSVLKNAKKLKVLELGCKYNHKIRTLPKSLEKLTIYDNQLELFRKIPKNIELVLHKPMFVYARNYRVLKMVNGI